MGQRKVLYFMQLCLHYIRLMPKWRNLYIQYAWISIMKKQSSNQNVKVENMLVFVKTFDYYHHKFNFGNFFNCPAKL